MKKELATLAATSRSEFGKGASRAMRRNGQVPVVIYSEGKEALHLAVEEAALVRLTGKARFFSNVLNLDVDGQKHLVLPRDVQSHPVTDRPEHADFLKVNEKSRISVRVPVKFTNHEKSPGIKRGGTLNMVRREVELYCTPVTIPSELVVDLTGLKISDSVHISHIQLPEGVTPVIDDRDFTVATIVGRRGDKDEDEAAAAAEGAAPAAA